MPAARPSEAKIKNAIAAFKAGFGDFGVGRNAQFPALAQRFRL